MRAENRSLRLMTLGGVGSPSDGSNSVDTDASFAQQQISELRDSYSVSVKSLEVMVSHHMILLQMTDNMVWWPSDTFVALTFSRRYKHSN